MLLEGYAPFGHDEDTVAIYQHTANADYSFDDDAWKDVSDHAKQFISQLILVDPQKRLTAQVNY